MTLVFVYNANSGGMNSIVDSLHKLMRPSTYNCNLCAITFGIFSEDAVWKSFRNSTHVKMEFYHKNEFINRFSSFSIKPLGLPVIMRLENDKLDVFISKEELNSLSTSQELIDIIKRRLALD